MATSRFEKVLVANRGEIAVRVIRACRESGYRTVAVASEVDRDAVHVALADEVVHIGPATARDSYLSIPKLMDAIQQTGAQAVHPGYGFLSENAEFARACVDAGIVFIGPTPEAIQLLGNKVQAREVAAKAEVPCLSGSKEPVATAADAHRIAESVGYPVLLKAAAGGGGKGMRVVHNADQMAESLARASSEAMSAFKDGSVYVEKYLASPHHVEIQILGDLHGNLIYLGERECSIQRRHQKIVEEAPSPTLDADLRRRMGDAAVRIAKAAGYHGAGTVEFLVDESGKFYFLEVNTRLQVEHPVTELVTGLDLVKLQLAIAQGERLPLSQADIKPRGWAIECRLYAEDHQSGFLPSPGKLRLYRRPSVPFVREDTGVREGANISAFYDPMISKVMAWGTDRNEALERLKGALEGFAIAGIRTSLPFLIRLLDHPEFRAGRISTDFIEKHRESLFAPEAPELVDQAAIAAAIARTLNAAKLTDDVASSQTRSGWKEFGRRQAMSPGYRF